MAFGWQRLEVRACSIGTWQRLAARPGKRRQYPQSDLHNSRADFTHASQLGFWTREEAAAYSLGYDPKFLATSLQRQGIVNTRDVGEYKRRLELVWRALIMEDLEHRIRPYDFVSWSVKTGLELPNELLEVLGMAMPDSSDYDRAADFKVQIEELKSKCAQQERLLREPRVKRMKSIYKLIAGVAMGRYGFDPNQSRNQATTSIRNDLQNAGLDLDDETILGLLRESYRAIHDL